MSGEEEIRLQNRPETADLIVHLAKLLLSQASEALVGPRDGDMNPDRCLPPQRLKVLDLCTGSGCIPILLHNLLYPPLSRTLPVTQDPGTENRLILPPRILGVDISGVAISLAKRNLQTNVTGGSTDASAILPGGVGFIQGDILDPNSWVREASTFFNGDGAGDVGRDEEQWQWPKVDIVISNPPYISPRDYIATTARSVRRWEPKIALVPPSRPFCIHPTTLNQQTAATVSKREMGDDFYPYICYLAHMFHAKTLLVEVGGDPGQAHRVQEIFAKMWDGKQNTAIWRDWGRRKRGVVVWRGPEQKRQWGEQHKGGGETVWDWLLEDVVKGDSGTSG